MESGHSQPASAKDMFAQTLDGLMALFRVRVLSFDIDAAQHHAELALGAKVLGPEFPTPNGYIDAIAASGGGYRGFTRYGPL